MSKAELIRLLRQYEHYKVMSTDKITTVKWKQKNLTLLDFMKWLESTEKD